MTDLYLEVTEKSEMNFEMNVLEVFENIREDNVSKTKIGNYEPRTDK
jgi:hypothetical protein